MAKKTIVTNVTVHVPADDHVPNSFNSDGSLKEGNYSAKAVPPGEEVTLDAKEADRILKKFGGWVVGPKTAAAPVADETDADDDTDPAKSGGSGDKTDPAAAGGDKKPGNGKK